MKKELLVKYGEANDIYLYEKKDKQGVFFGLIRSLILEWSKGPVSSSVPGTIQDKFLELATGFIWFNGFKEGKEEKEPYLQEISDWSLQVVSSFFNATMKELGATNENMLTTVKEGEQVSKAPIFTCDMETGNICMLVTRLDGSYIKYKAEKTTIEKQPINGEETDTELLNYQLVRKVKPDSGGKYKIPYQAGTFPFFPENIKEAYANETPVDTLFITEGLKKAFKGCVSGGLYVVGLSSISHYRCNESSKAKPKLHKEIIDFIRTCKVKNVVVLWDGDCINISMKDLELQQNLDTRPRSFFNYVKNISKLVKDEIKEKIRIYFSSIKSSSIQGSPKGLDDLLYWAEKQRPICLDRVVKDLLGLKDTDKYYTRTFDITSNDARVNEFFCLHDAEAFYLRHCDHIEQREFLFSGDRYVYINATNALKMLQPAYLEHVRWIGDDFYTNVDEPTPLKDGTLSFIKRLKNVAKGTLKDLYGTKFVQFMVDKHYTGFCNIANHWDYQHEIVSGSNKYYNKYHPFEWDPEKGDFKVIEGFVKHIFGDQYEMGLDYIQLLLNKPMQKLPVICLYSPENATGKSKFGELLSVIFKNNVIFINNEDLKSEFGTARFADKLLAVCDETLLDRKNDVERIKMLTTAETPILCNPKGFTAYEMQTHIKIIFNSNNLRMIHATEHDERFWIIRVPQPKKKDPNLMDKMRLEIPAFIEHLKNRKMSTKEIGRMWFDPKLIKTDALKEVVRVNEHSNVQELRNKLEDYFIEFPQEDTLMLSTKDLIFEFMPGKVSNWIDEICGQRLKIQRFMNAKGKTVIKRSYFLKKEPNIGFTEGVLNTGFKTTKIAKASQRVWVFHRADFAPNDLDYSSDLTAEAIEEEHQKMEL